MSDEPEQTIILESNDGKQITVSKAVAFQSQVVSDLVGNLIGVEGIPIPMTNVDGHTLHLVLQYLQLIQDDSSWTANPSSSDLPDVDRTFFDELDTSELVELMLAGDYMIIPRLTDTACSYVAKAVAGRSGEEIAKIMNTVMKISKLEMLPEKAEEKVKDNKKGRGSGDDESSGEGPSASA